MKNLRRIIAAIIALSFVSCSSIKVVTDVDKTVDFSSYKTFSFLGWQDDSDKILNDMDKKRLHEAFKKEFDARGMQYLEENGDIDISLFIVVDQKTSTTAYTNYYGSHYGRYGRYRGGWGYGHAQTTYTETDYLQGTLVLDVFDGKSKDQIWQGVATSTISENPQKREKTVPKKTAALMKRFPIKPIEK